LGNHLGFHLNVGIIWRTSSRRFVFFHPRVSMTTAGAIEYLRRVVTLILFVTGLVHIQRPVAAGLYFACTLAFYLFLPAAKRPQSALVHDRLAAIILPDVTGFLLTGVFFAMPFWIAASAGLPAGRVHPVAIMLWPLAIGSLAILFTSARYASFWLRIDDDGLYVTSAGRVQFVPYGQIVRAEPYRRGLPRWMRALTPLLAAAGHHAAAGAVILARDSTGIRLRLADGGSIVIRRDAFEKPYRRILRALKAHGVAFNGVAFGNERPGG